MRQYSLSRSEIDKKVRQQYKRNGKTEKEEPYFVRNEVHFPIAEIVQGVDSRASMTFVASTTTGLVEPFTEATM